MGRHTIDNQLVSSVCACLTARGDKRALKKDDALEHQFPGVSHYGCMKDFAKNFGQWVKAEFPDIKWARDITHDICNKYLDMKANTCVKLTLEKYEVYLGKLEKCVNHCFSSANVDWTSELIVPMSRKNPDDVSLREGVRMDRVGFEKCVQHEKNPVAADAYMLAANLGLRIEGLSQITTDMVKLDVPGRYNLGQVHLFKPDGKGIEKGGRPRIIDIRTPCTKAHLSSLCNGKISGERLIPLSIRSISRYLNKTMRELGIKDKYKNVGIHGIRKLFGQELYDFNARNGIDRKENIRMCNNQLGHGDNRGVRGISTYIDAYEY